MASDIKKSIRTYLNPIVKGPYTDALIEALAAGDENNRLNLLAVKEQMFIATASSVFLEKLMSGIGVTKPPGVGISDDLFRGIGIEVTNSKIVTNIFLDVLQIFYGEDAVRANVLSGRPEGFVLSDGMTLLIKIDANDIPLIVTFKSNDFTNIAHASATEVANVISKTAFNSGYTLTSSAFYDTLTKQTFVQLMSGTKGPKSMLAIVGGSAQNILRFPAESLGIPKIGTEFSTSFDGPYVKFTWTGGSDPGLSFVNIGDYVNIYGSGYLSENQGTFLIEQVQGGSVGQAFFEIINPTFTPQGPVTLTQIGGYSGNGTVKSTIKIAPPLTGFIRSSNIVTVNTIGNHGFSPGQTVTLTGAENTSFNGSFVILSTPLPTSFTYAQFGMDAVSGNGFANLYYNIAQLGGAIRSAGTSTITTTANHGLVVNQIVQVANIDDSSFDGFITITGVTSNTFTYTQNSSNDVTFFNGEKQVLQKLSRYATVYEASPYEVTIYVPATTKIVKRFLPGSWHVHDSPIDRTFIGSYVFDPKNSFAVSKTATPLTESIFSGQIKTVGFGTNTSEFPDSGGFVVFDWGTSNQEGPVKYLGRPSSGSLLFDPSYRFKKTHVAGSDMRYVRDTKPYTPKPDGTDYQAYLTSTSKGRIEAINLINTLKASGIVLSIIIVYPQNPGWQDVVAVYA